MRRLLFWALAALWVAPCAPAQAVDDSSSEIGAIVSDLASISGLEPHSRLSCSHLSREQVKQYFEQRVQETVKPEEIRAEEATLKKLGLAPADFDLKRATIDLLSEQASAFYDLRKRKLFLIDSGSSTERQMALVHEIAHALADQRFHLNKYTGHGGGSDDAGMARQAVMEGQATWLTSEYFARQTGKSLKDAPRMAKELSDLYETSGGHSPAFDRAPLYLRETLLFPYAQGVLFQQALVEKLGQAGFAEPFRHPPVSTQQILHPDKYLERAKPLRPPLPTFSAERNYRDFTEGDMGELDYSILLRQYAGEKESAALAPEWRGGSFRLFERKDLPRDGAPDWKKMVLACSSEWSGADPARRYFELYRKVLAGKWKTFVVTSHSDDQVSGQGDDGYFLLRRDGPRVTSLEGLPSPEPLR